MLERIFCAPPSPPSSPSRMSDRQLKPGDQGWQARQTAPPISGQGGAHSRQNVQQIVQESSGAHSIQATESYQPRPTLRTHRSLPFALASPSSLRSHEPAAVASALGMEATNAGPSAGRSIGPSGLEQTTFGGSAPASPVFRLSPRSPFTAQSDAAGDDDELELAMDEQGEDDNKRPMTAAELRNQKRKMKRFRSVYPVRTSPRGGKLTPTF